jgi:hypothetical protein
MRSRILVSVALLFAGVSTVRAAADQPPTFKQVVDKIISQEQAEMQMLHQYSPLVETYIQNVKPDSELGAVPNGDHYFLGRAELNSGVELESLVQENGKHRMLNSITHFFSAEFLPRGFLQMIYLDVNGFDREHYNFKYAGEEFLGEVRCLIFDVDPLPDSGKGRFAGRIWVEDQDYHVVRFNGSYTGSTRSSFYFNFDSWRSNSGKNEWLPAFIYSEEGNVQYGVAKHSPFQAFKSQTRLWGYDLKQQRNAETLSMVLVENPQVKDQAEVGRGYSTVQAKRAWNRQAEDNVAAKMQRSGLMAPYGDVDKLLETVVNNLEVTNNLDIQPEVRCRVLMTSTLESFTMGHTIVLSRGLIDVLPDEASLAAVMAHELGHVLLGHRMDTQFAFFNRMRFDEKETFHHFGFARNDKEERAANDRGAELLKKSPYANQSASAQAFFVALQERAKDIPNLISPHLGDSLPKSSSIASGAVEEEKSSSPDSDKNESAAALPLGGRVMVDPWDDHLVMLRASPDAAVAKYEKTPFEVSPFLVYLTRQSDLHPSKGAVEANSNTDPD